MKFNGHFREWRLVQMSAEDLHEIKDGLYWTAYASALTARTHRETYRTALAQGWGHGSARYTKGAADEALRAFSRVNAQRRQIKRAWLKVLAHTHAEKLVESEQAMERLYHVVKEGVILN